MTRFATIPIILSAILICSTMATAMDGKTFIGASASIQFTDGLLEFGSRQTEFDISLDPVGDDHGRGLAWPNNRIGSVQIEIGRCLSDQIAASLVVRGASKKSELRIADSDRYTGYSSHYTRFDIGGRIYYRIIGNISGIAGAFVSNTNLEEHFSTVTPEIIVDKLENTSSGEELGAMFELKAGKAFSLITELTYTWSGVSLTHDAVYGAYVDAEWHPAGIDYMVLHTDGVSMAFRVRHYLW